ncbi:MAG: PLP-dependent aminotransferase family protein [Thermotaleaceae bacterium]
MRISIDKSLPTPVYIQIKNEIKALIHHGALPKGFSLPPERKLAGTLQVSRSTVIKAYEELKALGLVSSHRGMGTRVASEFEQASKPTHTKVLPLSWYPFFDKIIASTHEHTVKDVMEAAGTAHTISFAAGIADPQLYPMDKLQQIQQELWLRLGKEMLTLSAVEGYYPLRESIAKMLTLKDIRVSPKEVMILSGSMQGLDFAARAFIQQGDVVLVEEPSFLGALQLFRLQGARVIGIPMDAEGMKTEVLELFLQRHKPKFIYTMPTFQNPTGVVMSLGRRYELLNLAYKYQIPILEDDPYGELRYEGTDLPPLKALDPYQHVIYLSTFSKVFSSGFRVGWVAAPLQVIKKFSLLKQMTDLHVNNPGQYLFDTLLRSGLYESHLPLIRSAYRKKRDIMAASLREKQELPITFDIPQGGYYIWAKLPQGIPLEKFALRASQKGVVFTPGNLFYPQESDGEGYMRLNFTYEREDVLQRGMDLLWAALEEIKEEYPILSIQYSHKPIV